MKQPLLVAVYGVLMLSFMLFFWYYGIRDDHKADWDRGSNGLTGRIEEKYVMVTFQSGIDYWRPIMKGFEDAAAELGVSVEFRGATQYDPDEQVTVLEQAIAKRPAGIAVSAINPEALNGAIAQASEAGIPVVLFDSGAEGSEAHAFLGTDNYRAGEVAAREMGRLLDGQGEVAVLTQLAQLNHKERTDGFRDTILDEYPGIRIVDVVDGRGEIGTAERIARQLMDEHPGLDGFFATQANYGAGIGQALKALDANLDKAVISFDTDKITLDLVAEGTIDVTLAQGTWLMGYWSLMELFHIQHGFVQPGNMEARNGNPVPPVVDTGITVVTKDNVEHYYAK